MQCLLMGSLSYCATLVLLVPFTASPRLSSNIIDASPERHMRSMDIAWHVLPLVTIKQPELSAFDAHLAKGDLVYVGFPRMCACVHAGLPL